MKHHSRELLVTTKVAQNWQDDFDQQVDGLMSLISKVDNDANVQNAAELMDVYHNTTTDRPKKAGKKTKAGTERPFEFVVFRN
ncbi:hypothetical protein ACTHGU_12690 [Chitinophagaceae bacterium MMS25-I14]